MTRYMDAGFAYIQSRDVNFRGDLLDKVNFDCPWFLTSETLNIGYEKAKNAIK